ncbi:MAG: hypothetical protein HY820_17365 [Acidobacteria bacterium]|nr:hypothetical protein [Acidobacteriota bacterium]
MNVEQTIEFLLANQANLDTKIARLATIAEMQLEAHAQLQKETAARFADVAEQFRRTDEQFQKTKEVVDALSEDIRLLFKIAGNKPS